MNRTHAFSPSTVGCATVDRSDDERAQPALALMDPQRPRKHSAALRFCMSCVALLLAGTEVSAQQPDRAPRAASVRQRAVDQIILTDHTRLWGAAVEPPLGRLLVRSQWMKENVPDLWQTVIVPSLQQHEQTAGRALSEALAEKLAQWQTEPNPDPARIGLVTEVIRRLEPQPGEEPPLLILNIPASVIAREIPQPANVRPLGVLGVLNHVPHVEILSRDDLFRALQQIPIDRRVTPPQTAANETDVRSAVNSIVCAMDMKLNSVSRFVKINDRYVPEDGSVGLETLLAEMMTQSLQSQLDELLNADLNPQGARLETGNATAHPNALPVKVQQAAEQKGHTTVIVSAMRMDAQAGTCLTTRQVFHRSDHESWSVVFFSTSRGSAAEATIDQVARINDDPQLRQIKSLAESLGVGNAELSTAFQMGAAVQNSLRDVDAHIDAEVSRAIGEPLTLLSAAGIPIVTLPQELPAKSPDQQPLERPAQ